MKIFKSTGSGASRALKSWKCIVIVWFVSLLLASLLVIPVKGIMKAGFGSSTITELLAKGINLDVILDLEKYLSGIISYLSSGFFLFLLLGFIVYSFFAGGLFKSVSNQSETLSVPCFFRASAKYFWYFLGICFMVLLMIIISGFLIIGLPAGLAAQSESGSSAGMVKTMMIVALPVYLIILMIMLLIADYSRAWVIASDKPALFKALGFGFSATFKHFWSSFPMMVIIMLLVAGYTWLFSTVIGLWKPETGGGVFLLFLVSQLLVFIKILLKTWRYGSVTALMEMNKPNPI